MKSSWKALPYLIYGTVAIGVLFGPMAKVCAAVPTPGSSVVLAYGHDDCSTNVISNMCARLTMPPSGDPKGLVIWIHGGGWSGGDMEGYEPHLDLVRSKGWATLNVNYPLVPEAEFPMIFMAVNQVMNAVATGACTYCDGRQNDLWRFVSDTAKKGYLISGDSAGGHLAMLAAMASTSFAVGPIPQCVLSVAGPMDLRNSADYPAEAWEGMAVPFGAKYGSSMQSLMSPIYYVESNYWAPQRIKRYFFVSSPTDLLVPPDKVVVPMVKALNTRIGGTRAYYIPNAGDQPEDGGHHFSARAWATFLYLLPDYCNGTIVPSSPVP